MANTDTATPALSTGTSSDGNEPVTEQRVDGASTAEAPKDSPSSATTTASPPSVSASNSSATTPQPQPSTPSARPSLVPLGSSQSSTTSHPKKFSAVNVNKKFLEKTAQAASATASATSSSAKSSPTVARPAITPAASHSRLVTAKLTASPVSSTAGWSRPASVAPTANPSPNSTSPLPTSANASNPGSVAPQLPHAGKVIQPQPKTVAQLSTMKDTIPGSKPVWGNAKPPSAPVRLDIPPEDFPTAAEAVRSTLALESAKKSKSEEAAKSTEAAKQARLEDADAFRGVHLDPNAHHWDEMEEDDDDFLGGVVEFGDGRQYKVESVNGDEKPSSPGPGSRSPGKPENVRDRDVDDFDRSWPKSKTSPLPTPNDLPIHHEASRSPTTSLNGLHPSSSPVESSRVLFNERSNRLEPYNHSRPGPPSLNKRPGYLDADSRHSREFAGQPANIQVLHKPPGEFAPRNRRFSGASNSSAGGPVISPRDGFFPRRDGPPPSPRMSRDGAHLMAPSTSHGGRERDAVRRGSMGPPPVPPRALKSAQENGRQLPPHLTQVPPVRREPRPFRDEPLTPASSKAPSLPSQSPLLTHSQLSAVSPVIGTVAGLPLPAGTDLEVVRKDVMHNAAARAKQRREQEEAEREAQKERARQKAQELEEKMKAAALEKEKEEQRVAKVEAKKNPPPPPSEPSQEDIVNSFIAEAVESSKSPVSEQPTTLSSARPAPFSTDPTKRPSTFPPRPSPPSAKPESWRSNAPSAPPLQQRRSSSGFVASATTALDAAVDMKKEDLEIVDFSDMSNFVKAPRPQPQRPQTEEGSPSTLRPPRPVASDFMEEKILEDQSQRPEPATWRRKSSIAQPDSQPTTPAQDVHEAKESAGSPPTGVDDPSQQRPAISDQTTPSPSSSKESLSSQGPDSRNGNGAGPPRTPRTQAFFKEATMSSLDDTMSRIKGAIVHMKSHEVPKALPSESHPERTHPRVPSSQPSLRPPRERWVPPALRPRHSEFPEDDEREVFDVTVLALPPSPPPSSLRIQLPKQSRIVEFISRKQLQNFHRPPYPARVEQLLSFEPPVEGMNRRDLSLNDVLFRKPINYKGKLPKYRVLLPRRQNKITLRGFGKPPVADSTTSWRKAAPAARPSTDVASLPVGSGLETMSRSPPPDTPLDSEASASLPKPSEPGAAKPATPPGVRTRSQPKMPAGSAVVVMRDSKMDVIGANVKTPMNFIVSDELEEAREPAQTMEDLSSDSLTINPVLNGQSKELQAALPDTLKPSDTILPGSNNEPVRTTPAPPSISEAKPSESTTSTDRAAFPTQQESPWAKSSLIPSLKESTSRGPDPEHLKALWSQPSEKSELHPVNSLEAIPDDLTSLPFTLHEVKSEDGATPPPAPPPQPPSRMSLHDVTRAFQQVPQSSATTTGSTRPPISPPSTNAPVARPTGYSYAVPPNGMRPSYASYSPITSHSPAPPMMYSPHPPPMNASPVPGRMQVNPYGPSMWMMPVMPPPTNGGNIMRPPPYPAPQMMPYSPSPPANGVYPQHPPTMMQHQHPPSQNGGPANRSRSMPGMSPAMSQSPMYPPSPMLMHAHAHPPPVMQNHGYGPMPAGRGQPRTDSNASHLGHQQHPPYPPPAPSAPFARPGW